MKRIEELLSILKYPIILAAIIFGFVTDSFYFTVCEGPSMSHVNRREITFDFVYKSSNIEYGDLVFVKVDGSYYGKRVIGVPGDLVEVVDGVVYINGEKETKYAYNQTYNGVYREAQYLGEDEYFICGDNRGNSKDSRRFGPVKAEHKYINLFSF